MSMMYDGVCLGFKEQGKSWAAASVFSAEVMDLLGKLDP